MATKTTDQSGTTARSHWFGPFVLGLSLLLLPGIGWTTPQSVGAPDSTTAGKPVSDNPPDSPRTDDGTPHELVKLEEHFGLVTKGPGLERLMRVQAKVLAALTEEERNEIKAIRILDDDTVNAFATPAGYIYFFAGLINEFETDDQCAAVLAHEITHVLHDHGQEINKDAWKYHVGGLLAAILTKEPGLMTAGQLLGHEAAMSYSRKAETDADTTGLGVMTKAGYAPVGMLEFMSRLEWAAVGNPLLEEGYFLTHPYPAERREAITKWMRDRGYRVPVQVQKTRPPVSLEDWRPDEESAVAHLALHLAGEEVFRFAGTPDESRERAERTVVRLQAVLEAGAFDYDFTLRTLATGPQITTKHGYILTIREDDALLAGVTKIELAEKTLKRLKQILWERRIRQRMGT